MWKGKLLSMAGRTQLIRSVLSNLPTYFLSLFRIPDVVAKRSICMQKRFFWGGNDEVRKLVTVSWKSMEALKEFGGLGLTNIHLKNLGLLSK